MTKPAENAGLAGIPIVATAAAAGASTAQTAIIACLCLAVPRAVTLWIDHGGLRGIRNLVLYGRRR